MATRQEKLMNLRRVVEAAPDDRFEMGEWSSGTACGTAHCAAGWARLDPWFVANTSIARIFNVRTLAEGEWVSPTTINEERRLGECFELAMPDVWNLFYPFRNAKKADVLVRIDRVLGGEPAVDMSL